MRDSIINRSAITDEYTIYLEIETQKHIMIYKKNEDMRIDYILDLKKELMKIESYHKDSNKIEIMVNDIKVFLNQRQVDNTR